MKTRGSRFRLRLKKGQARFLRILGYPLFAVSVFLLSFYLSLPLDRIKDRLERELSQEPGPPPPGSGGLGIGLGMDVSIGQLGFHLLPLGASASEVTLRPRRPPGSSESETSKPKPMFVDGISVRVPFSTLLGNEQAGAVELQALGGSADAEGAVSPDGVTLRAHLAALGLARAPILAQLLPLPLVGTLSGQADLKVPARKIERASGRERDAAPKRASVPPPLDYSKATGFVEIKLEQGVLGDGKAKLSVPGDPFLAQGLTFPKLALGTFGGRVVIERGRATLSEVHARSADAEIWIEGYIELRDPIQLSDLRLYLRFLPLPALIQREPTIEILNNAMSIGKRSDGALGFAITGSLAAPRSRPAKEPPEGVSVRPGSLGQVGKDIAPSLRMGGMPPASPSVYMAPREPVNSPPPVPNFPPPPPPSVPPPSTYVSPPPPNPLPPPMPVSPPPPPPILPPGPPPGPGVSHGEGGAVAPGPHAGSQMGGIGSGPPGNTNAPPPSNEGGGDRPPAGENQPEQPPNPPGNQKGF